MQLRTNSILQYNHTIKFPDNFTSFHASSSQQTLHSSVIASLTLVLAKPLEWS